MVMPYGVTVDDELSDEGDEGDEGGDASMVEGNEGDEAADGDNASTAAANEQSQAHDHATKDAPTAPANDSISQLSFALLTVFVGNKLSTKGLTLFVALLPFFNHFRCSAAVDAILSVMSTHFGSDKVPSSVAAMRRLAAKRVDASVSIERRALCSQCGSLSTIVSRETEHLRDGDLICDELLPNGCFLCFCVFVFLWFCVFFVLFVFFLFF